MGIATHLPFYPHSISNGTVPDLDALGLDAVLERFPLCYDNPLRAAPAMTLTPPEPPMVNAVRFPTLANLGFIFPEGVAVGGVVAPARRCPTCGHECAESIVPR